MNTKQLATGLRTAKALGFAIPQSISLLTDQMAGSGRRGGRASQQQPMESHIIGSSRPTKRLAGNEVREGNAGHAGLEGKQALLDHAARLVRAWEMRWRS